MIRRCKAWASRKVLDFLTSQVDDVCPEDYVRTLVEKRIDAAVSNIWKRIDYGELLESLDYDELASNVDPAAVAYAMDAEAVADYIGNSELFDAVSESISDSITADQIVSAMLKRVR